MEIESRMQSLVDDLMLLPDARERLDALAHWGKSATALPEALATEANRVDGCISRVHLEGNCDSGSIGLRLLADSVMVRGLVGVTVRLADGCPAAELALAEIDWPRRLQLDRQITPTRLNGLAAVARRIQSLAREALADPHVD